MCICSSLISAAMRCILLFCFKQKTAYVLRISDWSSDVCSSDLGEPQDIPKPCTVVHGWHDRIVPLAQAQRFAREHNAALHILDSDHTLNDQLPMLDLLLDHLLADVLSA